MNLSVMTIQQCTFKAKQENPATTFHGLDLQIQMIPQDFSLIIADQINFKIAMEGIHHWLPVRLGPKCSKQPDLPSLSTLSLTGARWG